MKSFLLTYLFPAVLALAIAYGCRPSQTQGMRVCHQTYALCTSAKCVPMPDDPSQAVCNCEIREGKSMATVPCANLAPTKDEKGVNIVYSTFSLDQFSAGLKGMKCPSGTPWTWCLNKRCTVDPADSTKAVCICDVMRSGEWTTAGGNCDTSTCSTGYWSGATLNAEAGGEQFMMKELGLKQSPVKWCP